MPEPKIRLLCCRDCRTVEDLPDYQGDPSQDHFLNDALVKHKNPDGSPHDHGALCDVKVSDWSSPRTREAILRKLPEATGHTGLDPEFYSVKATFEDDALRCFNKHHRNPKCNEYKSRSKVLTPTTQQLRKEAGVPKYNPAQHRYLCEFCPVHSVVATEARWKAGLYK